MTAARTVSVQTDGQWPSRAGKVAGASDAGQSEAAAGVPSTWTFVNRRDGQPVAITCMTGCETDHSEDTSRPKFPEDIRCEAWDEGVSLSINEDGEPRSFRVLSAILNVTPFDAVTAARLPNVSVEVLDGHWMENLDPDGLATVMSTLAGRLEDLRLMHARLVAVRAEYVDRIGGAR